MKILQFYTRKTIESEVLQMSSNQFYLDGKKMKIQAINITLKELQL